MEGATSLPAPTAAVNRRAQSETLISDDGGGASEWDVAGDIAEAARLARVQSDASRPWRKLGSEWSFQRGGTDWKKGT